MCSGLSLSIQGLFLHCDAAAAVLVQGKLIKTVLVDHANRKNGCPAITDANLVLGRILPELLPSIFGEDAKQHLNAEAVDKAIHNIAHN